MADWRGRGGGRGLGQPSVPGLGGIGAGGGRRASQPSIPGIGGIGAGGGRGASQPSIPGIGGTGAGGGRSASQPTISDTGPWVGRGSGRSSSQPTLAASTLPNVVSPPSTLQESSSLGARTTASTSAMTNGVEAHVADPEGNFIFALEIDHIEIGQFLECSGLKSSTSVFELEEGGVNDRVHKLPGQSRWENIVLRYGVTGDISLLQWRDEILQDEFGASSRRNGSIVVKNNQMEVVRRYNFLSAWPVSWEGPAFSSKGAELAIEAIELAHHGIYLSNSGSSGGSGTASAAGGGGGGGSSTTTTTTTTTSGGSSSSARS